MESVRLDLSGDHDYLSSIEEVLDDVRKGRMIILVDDEDRENEGDLVIPAENANAEAINFMAKHARGLICLALTEERCADLGLELMTRANQTRHQTAFTVSIEAREGVTTGISAADRARTVAVAIDSKSTRADISTPGHVFPLVARRAGILERAGHTEAAIDIARLAGFNPSGVICEIMNDDGTMARMPDLVKFSQHHGLKVARIADLIAYRRRHDTIVEKVVETDIDSCHGGAFRLHVYANTVDYAEHIALVKGDVAGTEPVLVRVHQLNLLDVLGAGAHQGTPLAAAMEAVAAEGCGVIVIIREPRPDSLSERVRAADAEAPQPALRDYGVGAQIIRDLGVRNMIVLSNTPRTVVGLEGYGLSIVGHRGLDNEPEKKNG
ncbi:MAG TPA: 3,4-dihydroxy-2-butanone-4-phosphate synthase [Alphaproteobacteria bacterium]|nr:3,4-dihydroxy-2-butanone-4-phosphate synthase [Alphaproteobacteria bacterium]